VTAVAATFYPSLAVGDLVTADLLQSMVPKYYVKPSNEARTSTTTLADDTDLQGIALAVGTWEVNLLGFFHSVTTANAIKTQWAFSGTWNSPVRHVTGPGRTNTAATDIADTMNTRAAGVGSDSVYGASGTTAFTSFREWSCNVVVTVAGNLSLQWAQNASSGNACDIDAGSTFTVRQIG
jgi:hypothetical protein